MAGGDVAVVSFSINADISNYERESGTGVGLELGIAEMLFVRAGSVDNVRGHTDGTTVGAGIAFTLDSLRIRADIASYPVSEFIDSDNTIFGIALDYTPSSSSQ